MYTALYTALVEKAKQDGARCISGATHFDNAAMRAVAEKQGRIAVAITYTQVLTEPGG